MIYCDMNKFRMSLNYSQTKTIFIKRFKLEFISETLHEYIPISI